MPGKTKVVAVGYASNAVGTVNDVARASALARGAGACSVVDAVHYALHGPIDVRAVGCDFLLCSAYKFFGPHVGLMYARRETTAQVEPIRLSTQDLDPPFVWETGTPNHEGLAGTIAAVDFIADLGERHLKLVEDRLPAGLQGRRQAVVAGMLAGEAYEQPLATGLRKQLAAIPGVTIYGPPEGSPRTSTVSFTLDGFHAGEAAPALGDARPLRLGRGLLRPAPRRQARSAGTAAAWYASGSPRTPPRASSSGWSPPSATSRVRCDDGRPRYAGRRPPGRQDLASRGSATSPQRTSRAPSSCACSASAASREPSASCSPPRSASSRSGTACAC